MACSCSSFCETADQQFTRQKAVRELERYRRKGAGATTRTLRDYLAAARAEAERRAMSDRVRFVHADFIIAADGLPTASVVTLDRVAWMRARQPSRHFHLVSGRLHQTGAVIRFCR